MEDDLSLTAWGWSCGKGKPFFEGRRGFAFEPVFFAVEGRLGLGNEGDGVWRRTIVYGRLAPSFFQGFSAASRHVDRVCRNFFCGSLFATICLFSFAQRGRLVGRSSCVFARVMLPSAILHYQSFRNWYPRI